MPETEVAATPAADVGARVSDAELADLRTQLARKTETEEALRRQNETLQRERNDAHRRITSELDQRFVAEEQAIENGLLAAMSDADRLEDLITDLNEKGEFRQAAKHTRELASAQTRIDGFNWRKQQIQGAKERATVEAAQAAQDPLGRYGAPGSVTRRWIDAHPRFLTDDLYNHEVVGAHKRALRQGLNEGTADYFEFIEREIGERKAEEKPAEKTPPKKAAEPASETEEEEAPLSEAATTIVADADREPEVEVEEPPVEDEGEIEMDELAIRQAQQRADERAARRAAEPKKPTKTAAGAPPSRGSMATAGAPAPGRVKLTRDEAERAIADYPPGKYMIDGQEVEVKNQMDAFRAYHSAREKLRSENRIGASVVR